MGRRPPLPKPHSGVWIVSEAGPRYIEAKDVTADMVGRKAVGLLTLPARWVSPFFVVTADALNKTPPALLQDWFALCLATLGLQTATALQLRSNGSQEAIEDRGQLASSESAIEGLIPQLRLLASRVPADYPGVVHWIIQERITPVRCGQLSNESRLNYERRDWTVEVEPHVTPGYTMPIAIRRWRKSGKIDLNLNCASEVALATSLRRVVLWGMQFAPRLHFEWVWDGTRIFVVQLDAVLPMHGVDPHTIAKEEFGHHAPDTLTWFRRAQPEDFNNHAKLRCAHIYTSLGYEMPTFYVLDCEGACMHSLLADTPPSTLMSDLQELTRDPLIIRTNIQHAANSPEIMSPRSDELCSAEEALQWIMTNIVPIIKDTPSLASTVCLIAHHYIPSVASAWSLGDPETNSVRIESLWGIPEGLYWFSHDTYEVDLKASHITRKIRYKGNMIISDTTGRWKPAAVDSRFNWLPSISNESYLLEIGKVSKQIAEKEGAPVIIMWFVEIHPSRSGPRLLPWFHSKIESTVSPNRVPRHKRRSSHDCIVKSTADWNRLRERLASGQLIERVRVDPNDVILIRNLDFARELGSLAHKHGFVIELAGGILSHVYYILLKAGARIECVDLWGTGASEIEYDKLVRDRIPVRISEGGERAASVALSGPALDAALRRKLVEEALEVLDAKPANVISELADAAEVINAIASRLGISYDEIETVRREKRRTHGGFDKGVMLTRTETPHAIDRQGPISPQHEEPQLLDVPPSESISSIINVPERPRLVRPDCREHHGMVEKIYMFEWYVNGDDSEHEKHSFKFPVRALRRKDFTLLVERKRIGALVRETIRLQLHPEQLELDFSE